MRTGPCHDAFGEGRQDLLNDAIMGMTKLGGPISGTQADPLSVDPATGAPAGDTIDTQAEQSCKNVAAILAAAGSDMTKVVKTTCFLADMADFAKFNEIYAKYFVSCPARSCVAAKALPKGVLCEIEAIAEV